MRSPGIVFQQIEVGAPVLMLPVHHVDDDAAVRGTGVLDDPPRRRQIGHTRPREELDADAQVAVRRLAAERTESRRGLVE